MNGFIRRRGPVAGCLALAVLVPVAPACHRAGGPAEAREAAAAPAAGVPAVPVEGQPLAANIQRVVEALNYLGAPLPADLRDALTAAGRARDGV